MSVCSTGVACFHGVCVAAASTKTELETCECEELYAGAQCGFRNGNLLFEAPLACVLIFSLALMGLRVAEQALLLLRFPESAAAVSTDFFAFPRIFEPTERRALALVSSYVGTWAGDAKKGPDLRAVKRDVRRVVENVLIVVTVALELVMWLQVTAIAFLPVVPWPSAAAGTAKLFRMFIIYPQWSHLKPQEFPHQLFYFAVAAVPAGLLVSVVLGIKRFPLFKPQPKDSPVEDACTTMLRLYSEWAAIPILIALLLPFECLFLGYELKGIPIRVAIPLNECFTPLQIAQMVLSFAAMCVYWLASTMIVFQLNCESSRPMPTLWTDVRYATIVQMTKAPLALAVVAFMNSNAILLCVSTILVSVTLGFVNAWVRPCEYSLINGMRMYGALLSAWSAAVGLAAAIMDDPTNKTIYEVWSVGAMGLSGASLASLMLFHTEDFWFRLSKSAAISESKLRQAGQTPGDGHHDEDGDDADANGSTGTKRQPFAKLTFRFRPQPAALKTIGEDEAESLAPPTSSAPQVQDTLKKADHGSRMPKKLSVLRRARSQKCNGSPVPI